MKYCNPIIRGFAPDPSICRAGEDYYLVTSSFEYFPGIPIYHSRDLVNWEQIGNCVQREEEFSFLQEKDSGGIWAPTIRYHKGVFYVTATLGQQGNFVISAADPAGEWSAPVWVPVGGIDPSLLFDGGKVYYCTNQSISPGREEITLEEIDIGTGALLSAQRTIWNGIGAGFLEAPHIYHIGEWYYLTAAEGGTNFNHMITAARSRDIWGPYESCPFNPILTNVHDTGKEVQCSGHGDLFEDSNGNWWMVHLAIRLSRRTMSHLGRETFLTPVVWREGWFLTGNDRKAVLKGEGPLWEKQRHLEDWGTDFRRKSWEPEWIFLRKPAGNAYERGAGKLRLTAGPITFEEQKNPVFAAVRQRDFECRTEGKYRFTPLGEADEAGMAIVLASHFHYRIGKKRLQGKDYLVVEKTAEDFRQTAYCEPVRDGELRMEIWADKEYYTFYYAVEEEPLRIACRASTRFLACETAGKCFTGAVIGLYAISPTETGAVMEAEEFGMKSCESRL